MVRILAKHYWVVNLLFIAAAAWLAALLTLTFIQNQMTAPPKPGQIKTASSLPAKKVEPYDQYAIITERNIFNPQEKGLKLLPLNEKKTGGPAAGSQEGGKAVSAGGYRLVGTITGPGKHAWAILQNPADRQQKIYRFQEEIDGGKIDKINRDHVRLNRQGQEEVLSFTDEEVRSKPPPAASPPSSPTGEIVKKLSPNRFLVNREDVTASVGNVNQFMTQARFKPNFVNGRPEGFSVSEIKPGSLMEKIGLRNNDVVKKVNGQVITKPEEVFQAYSQLLRDSNIEVEIERDNRVETFHYEIR